MSMDPTSISIPGVPIIGASAPSSGTSSEWVLDVTEESFGVDVLDRSAEVPVVVDFWAAWCGPCKQLSPVLERLAAEGNGSWVLAKIDVDANPRLAQAAQVQGIPAVKAVVGGQVVAEFTGAMPEAQVRTWVTELLKAAGEAGLGGPLPPPDDLDPDLLAGDTALANGDLDGAAEAYARLGEREPGNADAMQGLARVELMRRATSVDQQDLEAKLQSPPLDVDTLCAVADLQVLTGQVEAAFDALVTAVRDSAGDDRDKARNRLLELFVVVGDDDPAVIAGRRALASALF